MPAGYALATVSSNGELESVTRAVPPVATVYSSTVLIEPDVVAVRVTCVAAPAQMAIFATVGAAGTLEGAPTAKEVRALVVQVPVVLTNST